MFQIARTAKTEMMEYSTSNNLNIITHHQNEDVAELK